MISMRAGSSKTRALIGGVCVYSFVRVLPDKFLSKSTLKPGFHISQFIGDLLSGIAEGENDFRNTKDFIHR